MPHSFTKNHLHIIFGTKERRKLIPEPMLPRVWAYMAGICHNHSIFPVIVGGMRDHAHVLIDLPARVDLAKAVNLIKPIRLNGWVSKALISPGRKVTALLALASPTFLLSFVTSRIRRYIIAK